ncbi:cold-shock protein [Pedobacter mucosus]|uniref:cold-shock protein n=1 Tax=Pedobacter mucosus TaxID=2895286 RepID=UPI001EE3D4FA|nr:cold shock domain-containing protein [Pedobacter mucosus]UKT62602.1 cold shock domain-containing protein [Pedobacter mucosus]
MMRTGIIKSYNLQKSTGFITDENGEDISFYLPKIKSAVVLKSIVSFVIVMGSNGLIADSIIFISNSSQFFPINKASNKSKMH